jgi:cytochrome P450
MSTPTSSTVTHPTAAPGAPRQPKRKLSDLPGPRGLPLIGNALQLDPSRLHLILEDWARRFGPMYRVALGPTQVMVLSDLEQAQPLFAERPDGFRRAAPVEPALRELGADGVFAAEGDAWRRQRKLVMPAFSMKQQRELFPTVASTTELLRAHWQKAATAGSAVDARLDLMRYTVDVTSHVVFGKALGTLSGAQPELQDHLGRIFHTLNLRVNSVVPYWRVFKLPRDRATDRSVAHVQAFIAKLIGEANAELQAGATEEARSRTLLHAMLEAQREGDASERLSDQVVAGNVLTLLLAGEDTTSNTLTWMLHYLAHHPEVQRRLREEAQQVLGADTVVARYEDVSKLKYAVALTMEALRLRSAAPMLFFEPLQPTDVAGVTMPPGSWVIVLTRLIGTQDRHFTDAARFWPERWLAGSEPPVHNPRALLAFGGGPRTCPGRSLALFECAMVASMIVRNFQVEPVGSPDDVQERLDFTMCPSGVRVRFRALDGSTSAR